MRVATLILSLLLGLVILVQSCAIYAAGAIAQDHQMALGGTVGLLVAVCWLVAGAFVLARPTVSVVAFALAGVSAFAGSTGAYPDLLVWGVASLVLCALSVAGRAELQGRLS